MQRMQRMAPLVSHMKKYIFVLKKRISLDLRANSKADAAFVSLPTRVRHQFFSFFAASKQTSRSADSSGTAVIEATVEVDVPYIHPKAILDREMAASHPRFPPVAVCSVRPFAM